MSNNTELEQLLNTIKTEKDTKIIPENIKKGVTIFNVQGAAESGIDTSDATASENDIVSGKTAYVNNEKITGTVVEDVNTSMAYELSAFNDIPSMEMLSVSSVHLPFDRLVRAGCNYSMNIPYETAANTIGLTADKITKGNTILGIEGTYEGSSDYDAKLVPTDGEIAGYITEISENLDTSKVTNMNNMFQNCTSLTTIPLLNTSNVTNMNNMFRNCTSLTTIPLLNTSNVTNMQSMFNSCTSLTTIPELDTSKVTGMGNMFRNCKKLVTIPLLNTNKVTGMGNMFQYCTNLTTIPLLDTSSVTNMNNMFNGCSSLSEIPLLNTSSVTNMQYMFRDCTNLTDESLNNILAMCANATKVSNSFKTLADISLTSDQANRCKTLSNYSAFTAAGWTTGY